MEQIEQVIEKIVVLEEFVYENYTDDTNSNQLLKRKTAEMMADAVAIHRFLYNSDCVINMF